MVAKTPQGGLSDVRLRWPHIVNGTLTKQRKGSDPFPALSALMASEADEDLGQHRVLIKMPSENEAYEIREWLEDNTARYAIYGRYEWSDLGVRVTRDLKGLIFSFEDEDMAVFFKFRWASGM